MPISASGSAVRALLFDMDGTLIDNMSYHTDSWVEFFRRRGLEIDAARFFTDTAGRHGREILRHYFDREIDEADCAALLDAKEAVYREVYGPHQKLIPGVDDFLTRAARRGYRLAIGTAAPPPNITFTIDGLGLRDRFATIVGAADVARGKPAPDVYLEVARRLKIDPQHCVVFEDAPLGVEAARNAGMRAVVLTTSLPASSFAAYDNVVAVGRDFDELSRGYFAALL